MIKNLPRDNKAKIEAQDETGCTALHLACKKGSYDAVCLLLALGAKIFATDHR
jgi:ankyrin repeat protein